MSWYRPIKTERSKSERLRRTAKYEQRGTGRLRKPLRIRPENHIFFKTFSRSIYVNGFRVKVCTRLNIANYFGVQHSTVLRWADKGLLPEPFYMIAGQSGMIPVYLASQIVALRKVLGDLVQQGYVTIPWSKLPEHVAMLKEGYLAAEKRQYKRLQRTEEIEKPDRFGVLIF